MKCAYGILITPCGNNALSGETVCENHMCDQQRILREHAEKVVSAQTGMLPTRDLRGGLEDAQYAIRCIRFLKTGKGKI